MVHRPSALEPTGDVCYCCCRTGTSIDQHLFYI